MTLGKGNDLEIAILIALTRLQGTHPDHVRLVYHPEITLETDRDRIPDFDLEIRLPQETLHYFIEAQDRKKSSNDIVHKIHYIRSKHRRKTFIFVYREKLSPGIAKELVDDGVMIYNLEEFRRYIRKYSETLTRIASIDRIENPRDHAMLATVVTYQYQGCTQCLGEVGARAPHDMYFDDVYCRQMASLFSRYARENDKVRVVDCKQCGATFFAECHRMRDDQVVVSLHSYVEIEKTADGWRLAFHRLEPRVLALSPSSRLRH